ncbi:hypothetical protein [Nostoc punctiforme]|uniref:hypothetical protein n=1 Tax=Nostoc punctiforme TaxID=272131 RepID=UPI001427BF24|nr:hypothetical protein [Nostoc punctiforme]
MKSYRNQRTVRSSDRARSTIVKSTDMMHIAIQNSRQARGLNETGQRRTIADSIVD